MNLLQYSKRQEERLINKLADLGVDIIRHYGDREKDKGDVLAGISLGNQSKIIRFDHKSTRSKSTFTLNCNMLPKLAKECFLNSGDGISHAAISISFLNETNIYVASFIKVGEQAITLAVTPAKGGKHIKLYRSDLVRNVGINKMMLKFNEYTAYLYELSQFVYLVKEGL